MKPCLIYFKEITLSDDNKFTLDFSKVKKKHIHADKKKKIEELSDKSRLLPKKGAAYQNDIDYLLLKTLWYIKDLNYTYRFKLVTTIISQYSYKYKFFDTVEIVKFILLLRNLLVKDLISKERLLKVKI